MGIQVTLVPVELVWMVLQAFLGCQDPLAGRGHKEMSSLPGQVLLAHLVLLGQLVQKDFRAFLEAQGLQVCKANLDNQDIKDTQESMVTLEPLVPKAQPVLHVKGGILAGLEPEVYQALLDLQDPEVNREREALMVAQVSPVSQEYLVEKVYEVHQDCQDCY
ncbi:hypothetical protein D9C73_013872 [Collichthys lucidus]|uniref:Uncharacterized protein n=1 Tax=Collichthys lucidus TaxID=240159 RepID=A0A4U5UX66_COLLU|nr:hypothetical protein D9C73_013872 [Collichthys lucidus]